MKKVTEEELKEIQSLRTSLLEIITLIGEYHLNKVVIKTQLDATEKEILAQEKRFLEFQGNERVLFEKLQQKYGTGDINMETGEITE
jgi:hypothetical protein